MNNNTSLSIDEEDVLDRILHNPYAKITLDLSYAIKHQTYYFLNYDTKTPLSFLDGLQTILDNCYDSYDIYLTTNEINILTHLFQRFLQHNNRLKNK